MIGGCSADLRDLLNNVEQLPEAHAPTRSQNKHDTKHDKCSRTFANDRPNKTTIENTDETIKLEKVVESSNFNRACVHLYVDVSSCGAGLAEPCVMRHPKPQNPTTLKHKEAKGHHPCALDARPHRRIQEVRTSWPVDLDLAAPKCVRVRGM